MPQPIFPQQPKAPQVQQPLNHLELRADNTVEHLATEPTDSANMMILAHSTTHEDIATPLRVAHKKKKKAKKGMKPGAPAAVTIYGFDSPNTSCGEDSDTSGIRTPSMNFARTATPTTGSPLVRPSSLSRAISELKLGSKKTSPTGSDNGDVGNGPSVSLNLSPRRR